MAVWSMDVTSATWREISAEAGISNFYRQALQLLRDADPAVRRVAVEAAAKMVHPQLLPEIVEALLDPETREAASEVLPRIGEAAVPALVESLERHADDGAFRSKALRLLGLIGGDAATRALWDLIELADREERHLALVALSNCSPRDTGRHEGRLTALVKNETRDAASLFAAERDLAGEAQASVVERAIDYEISRIRHRIFLLLSFLYPDRDVLTAWDNYVDGDRRKLAYALELVDNFVSAELKSIVFPVLEHMDIERRLSQLDDRFDIRAVGLRARLIELGTSSHAQVSAWTAACARYVAAELNLDGGSDAPAPSDAERGWVEDTLRLKGVELFDELPEAVLAGIVPKLSTLSLDADQPVFVKGAIGDSMFVVAQGSVRVHDGPKTLGTVHPNQVFGEFTVLQSAPRTASATAAEPTRLVKFEQDDLYTLVAEEVSIARKMIETIVRRLAFNRNRRRDSEGRVSRVSISLKPLE